MSVYVADMSKTMLFVAMLLFALRIIFGQLLSLPSKDRRALFLSSLLVFPIQSEVHDQKFSRSGEHIDLSALHPQTGPDKVVTTVGGVYTIT